MASETAGISVGTWVGRLPASFPVVWFVFGLIELFADERPVYTAKLPPNIAAAQSSPNQSYVYPAQPLHQPPLESSSTISTPPAQTSEIPPAPYQHLTDSSRSEGKLPSSSANYHVRSGSYGSRNTMPPPMSSYKPTVQRSIGETLSSRGGGEDSPVMHETLSVIDEHITDLSTPRQSVQPPQRIPEDSESDYSSHLDRLSFLAGPETDAEENDNLTQEEVLTWDQRQMATHLRSLGVDPRHCDIFEEQEITGEVLLDMDASFLQMKEFDFGVMGKRLKTWHKIRDFQRDVRGRKSSQTSSLRASTSIDNLGQSSTRVTSGTTVLPRIPSLSESQPLKIRQSQHGHPTTGRASLPAPIQTQHSNGVQRTSLGGGTPPLLWRSSMGTESPTRATPSQIREAGHSRRHSSIDFNRQPDLQLSSTSIGTASTPNKQKSSFDRDGLSVDTPPSSTNVRSSIGRSPSVRSTVLKRLGSLDMSANSALFTEAPNLDLDRGYFSGNELDNRKARNVLRKSTSTPGHSRHSSMLDEPPKVVPAAKRHSRLSSVDSSREPGPLVTPASKAYHSSKYKGRFRSASARGPAPKLSPGGYSPTVTNLEDEASPNMPPSTGTSKMTIPAKARKLMGFRAASEAVTNTEKATASSPNVITETLEESPVASPDGSHTPSMTGQSAEVDNTDTSSKGTEHPGSVLGGKSQRARPKTKHETSAYAKGLLKITPDQARKQCDHSGWMKKKSSSIVTTFKPRLFILRGRRLSYYYSDNDTEERGIIDISGHKVLVANSDPMATLHATLTGAKATPISTDTAGETLPTAAKPLFYFKLVPPKAGMSRAVQFTKPTIHYFQVDTAAEGRKWMGEIMKATIDHDLTGFETTNKQKTISLAKARARKERPPALKETAGHNEDLEKKKTRETGLNIKGVGFDSSDPAVDKANVENVEPKVSYEGEKMGTIRKAS